MALTEKQILTSLAILQVNWDDGKNYIDNFIPFVCQAVLSLGTPTVSVAEVQIKLKSDYGLSIPQNTINSILKRSSRRGLLANNHGVYIPNTEEIAKINLDKIKAEVLRQHNAFIEKFLTYALEKHAKVIDRGEGEKLILSLIKQRDIEILACIVSGTHELPYEGSSKDILLKIATSFIVYVFVNDPEGYKYLDTIVKGNMLSNALLFSDLSTIKKKFENTHIYFDTPFLVKALKYEGDAISVPCKELLSLAEEAGAETYCFSHTKDEIYGILFACAQEINKPRRENRSAIYEHFLESHFSRSDIELEMATLSRKIERLGISISDTPSPDAHQIDEAKIYEYLSQNINYSPDEKQRAALRDVSSISAIYRMRRSKSFQSIEDCRALFVTTNGALCKYSQDFLVGDKYISESSFPLAITDSALTNVLWLKKPIAAPNLPTQHIIAECFAALQPSDTMWRRYLARIQALKDTGGISEDESFFLRYNREAHLELAEITLGDERIFSEGTPAEILDRLKTNIKKEALEKLEEETKRRIEAEEKSSKAEQEKLNLETKLDTRLQKMASNVSEISGWIVYIIVCVIIIGSGIFSFLPINNAILSITITIIGIIVVGLSTWSLITGGTVKTIRDRINNKVKKRTYSLLKHLLMPT
jgi:hypothetical protein